MSRSFIEKSCVILSLNCINFTFESWNDVVISPGMRLLRWAANQTFFTYFCITYSWSNFCYCIEGIELLRWLLLIRFFTWLDGLIILSILVGRVLYRRLVSLLLLSLIFIVNWFPMNSHTFQLLNEIIADINWFDFPLPILVTDPLRGLTILLLVCFTYTVEHLLIKWTLLPRAIG